MLVVVCPLHRVSFQSDGVLLNLVLWGLALKGGWKWEIRVAVVRADGASQNLPITFYWIIFNVILESGLDIWFLLFTIVSQSARSHTRGCLHTHMGLHCGAATPSPRAARTPLWESGNAGSGCHSVTSFCNGLTQSLTSLSPASPSVSEGSLTTSQDYFGSPDYKMPYVWELFKCWLGPLFNTGYVRASDISSLEPSTIKLRQWSVNFAHPTYLRDLGFRNSGAEGHTLGQWFSNRTGIRITWRARETQFPGSYLQDFWFNRTGPEKMPF